MYPYEPHSGTHPAPYWLRDDCHAKHYRDPYMNSFSCDDQLPLISSIGRGPRGAGITAKLLKDTDTEFIFSLVDDETGEQVFQSPNLAPAIVSVNAPKHTPIAGENYPITFSLLRGTDVSEYTVDIPSGAQGSLIYCLEDPIHLNSTSENENSGMWFKLANLGDTTFRTTIDHLLIYGEHDWTDKPIPRVNDIIFCPYYAEKQDGYSIGVSFGTIEAVENGTVVWTARTFVPSSDIELSENGTWIINGKDSGFVAKGEKGDKGPQGARGPQGEKGDTGPQGAQGVKGDTGPQGARGPQGEKGDTGPQGAQGVKGDPFTYDDFTEAQIAELQRPATEAATLAKQAIADVKATEAKLYPAAENILVGSEAGAVAHVEDAFSGAALRKITVEGACRQDGTPSPEAPLPIEVVENPVLNVTGRNLLTITDYAGAYNLPVGSDLKIGVSNPMDFDSVNGVFSIKKEIFPWNDGQLFATEPLPAGTYNISFSLWSDTGSGAYTIYVVSSDYIVYSVYERRQSGVDDKFLVDRKCSIKNEKVTVNDNQRIVVVAIVNETTDVTNEFYVETPLVSVAVQDTYAPYVGTSIPITLPAEHPYLAALPDGTADTIEVDKDGNASLVARVSKATIVASKIVNTWGNGYAIYGWPKDGRYSPNAPYDGTAVVCDKLKAESGSNIYHGLGIGVSVGSTSAHAQSCGTVIALEDGADVSSIDGAVLYYPLMTPVTYPLDKVTVPSLPESISNVWTNAEVTPRTGIEYTRDVNIVVANLESAIASITEG